MATNYRNSGRITDANLLIETGATITAGSLVWVDISGTNVVRAIRSFSAATPETSTPNTGLGIASLDGQLALTTGVFIGVLANTQTGVNSRLGGNQTGVTYHTQGVFEFTKTTTSSCLVKAGQPVYAVRHDVIRSASSGINAVPTNTTGANPIGWCVGFRGDGANAGSGAAVQVLVRINTNRSIEALA